MYYLVKEFNINGEIVKIYYEMYKYMKINYKRYLN